MSAYRDPEVKMIFDLSGGNLANDVLPFLDYSIIENSDKLFVGYSDLTCIINAILCKYIHPDTIIKPFCPCIKNSSFLINIIQ